MCLKSEKTGIGYLVLSPKHYTIKEVFNDVLLFEIKICRGKVFSRVRSCGAMFDIVIDCLLNPLKYVNSKKRLH